MLLSDSHDWLMWQAARALGEPIKCNTDEIPLPPPPVQPTLRRAKRARHWAGTFQQGFAAWMRGVSPRPCDLCYTRRQLRRHLERQFTRGMSWDNYAGNRPAVRGRVWVIEHIVPKSLFSEDEVVAAYALSNLRPLWSDENIAKGPRRLHLI